MKTDIEQVGSLFSEELANTWKNVLHEEIATSLKSIEQIPCSEALQSLAMPNYLITIEARQMPCFAIFSAPPDFIYALVNKMMGGSVSSPLSLLQEMEEALIRKFFTKVFTQLSNSLKVLGISKLKIRDIATKQRSITTIAPYQQVWFLNFHIKTSRMDTLVTLITPLEIFNTAKLPRKSMIDISHLTLEIKAVLGSSPLLLSEKIALQPGDIINLGRKFSDPIDLYVAGKKKFQAVPGLIGRFKGVAIKKEREK